MDGSRSQAKVNRHLRPTIPIFSKPCHPTESVTSPTLPRRLLQAPISHVRLQRRDAHARRKGPVLPQTVPRRRLGEDLEPLASSCVYIYIYICSAIYARFYGRARISSDAREFHPLHCAHRVFPFVRPAEVTV